MANGCLVQMWPSHLEYEFKMGERVVGLFEEVVHGNKSLEFFFFKFEFKVALGTPLKV